MDMNLEVMWRLLHLTFWLSAVTALLFGWVYLQRGQPVLALLDGVALLATAVGYGISVHLRRPRIGVQAIAIVDWLLLAVTITLQGGLLSAQLAWIVVLAPLLMLAGLKLALVLTAGTVVLIVGWYAAAVTGWMPPYREAPLSQRALSAALIACLFALAAWSALRWRTRLGEELKAARDEAIAAYRLKDRFVANLNHEIRTPMNALVAGAQLLDRRHLDGEQRVLVEAVQHSADHLLALVNDVLDYERLEAGEMLLDMVEFSVRELAGGVTGMFAGQAKAMQLSLSLELSEELPDIWIGDPTRLRQVLCNLLSNAMKFTPAQGRVVLRVSRSAVSEGSAALCFEVVDSGRGIAGDAQARLFQPYEQGDPSVARRFGGTGLGLAICKELLRLMNGSIDIESQPGAGSTFRVAVPLAPGNQDAQPLTSTDSKPEETKPPSDFKVMLVEDDAVNQIVMEAVLRDIGVQVLTASSGQEALDLLKQTSIDLVLMDCHMPEMDGLTTTRHWRLMETHQQRPRVPVIGLTGDVYRGAREACLAAGMDDYLTKPATPADISAVLVRWAPAAGRT
jgi:signal transduction histidine kinase/CheY-like chemotaxis protein